METDAFKPALIIVDLQEDFCPPNGSLAVTSGRDIVHTVNKLLDLPFALKVATQDWHPKDHISFASNHAGKAPFNDFIINTNPSNAAETYQSRLWPDHCVQNSPGAKLIPELDAQKIDTIIRKGTSKDFEMYSAFYPPLSSPRVGDSGLAESLKKAGITHVFVVGLAFDHCVTCTAIDAASEGFKTVIVKEGTNPVDPSSWDEKTEKLRGCGVEVVPFEGVEVARVRRT